MSFGDFAFSLQMRDTVNRMVESAVDQLRPRPRYAVVQRINPAGRTADVIFNGETNPVRVQLGSIIPAEVGQRVRVEGIKTDKFVTDVIGDSISPDLVNLFSNPGFEIAAERAAFPMSNGFYYEANAAYNYDGFHVTLNSGQVGSGGWQSSPQLGQMIPVSPGERLNIMVRVRRISGNKNTATYFNFIRVDGTYISSTGFSHSAAASNANWSTRTDAIQVPAEAAFMYVTFIHADTTPGSGYWMWDDIVIKRFPKDLTERVGEITLEGGDEAFGKIVCAGQAVSRSLYRELFGHYGTTHGNGDGSTTFNLPDMRGRTAFGLSGADTAFNEMGETGGATEHGHALSDLGQARVTASAANPAWRLDRVATAGWTANIQQSSTPLATSSTSVNSTGVALAGTTNNASSLPPYRVLRYMVRASA